MDEKSVSPDYKLEAERLHALWVAMGMPGSYGFNFPFALGEIKSAWLARRDLGSYRKELRRFRALTAKRRELRKRFEPDLREALETAGYLRADAGIDENEIRARMDDNYVPYIIPADDPAVIGESEEEREDRNIEFLLEGMGDYRKRQVTKLVVEPFLRLLDEFHVVPHPKRLPLSRMMQAFFDLLGIDDKLRPRDVGIRTIARELRKKNQRD
jgi:hypothetical protein